MYFTTNLIWNKLILQYLKTRCWKYYDTVMIQYLIYSAKQKQLGAVKKGAAK